jgi:short subunit dehydrogenase-like uncharacterized protein
VPDPRIILFGATGYTGRLVAEALLRRGRAPVLAGRNRERLDALAAELSPDARLDTAVADATHGSEVAALLQPDDVLVSTVGPFQRLGWAAVDAVTTVGATYLDSTGEPPFLTRVFTELHERAVDSGARLVPAFGYDFVPGSLAAGLALREAGAAATRVDVGYFVRGKGSFSGGTLASVAGVFTEPGSAFRDGALVQERPASRVRAFTVRGRAASGVSVGGTEHLTLPRVFPGLVDVDVFLGWTGPLSRTLQAGSAVGQELARLPGLGEMVRSAGGALLSRVLPGSTGGPDTAARAAARSVSVAEAYDSTGHLLARVDLQGPGPYDLTAELLAWGAVNAQTLRGSGVLGPVDGFGLETLEAGCAELGLRRLTGDELAKPAEGNAQIAERLARRNRRGGPTVRDTVAEVRRNREDS